VEPEPPEDAPADIGAMSALLATGPGGTRDGPGVDALFTALYRELHRIARRELHRGGGPLTLSATTLLHETYLDLCARGLRFEHRDRFYAYAARAMRGLIVDRSRHRQAIKRGAGFELTSFDATGAADLADELAAGDDLQPLSDALDALARADPALAELVELKYFCGFDLVDIARMRGVGERTVQRHWDKARAFLRHALGTP
jgi:RNA polymerase sigma factor (TIGR02999 family)